MVGLITNQSHAWWFEGHNSPRRSPWLQSTLTELDEKTKAMLKLIEEDADSFAQRAEMYYKKRPQLITMVEEFYRTHRSLAERFDIVKQDSTPRISTAAFGSPLSYSKTNIKPEKFANTPVYQSYDSFSEIFDPEESSYSETDEPPHDQESVTQAEEEEEDDQVENTDVTAAGVDEKVVQASSEISMAKEEIMKLREEIKKLKEENEIQRDELTRKDEEKREVIRQLSSAVALLKEENVQMRERKLVKECPKQKSPLGEFNKMKDTLLGKLFRNGASRNLDLSVVAL